MPLQINCIGDDKIMKRKNKLISKLSAIGITLGLYLWKTTNVCLATGIGTAEVQTATDNIKRVITSIAMPLGRSSNLCKYSSSRNKNDC